MNKSETIAAALTFAILIITIVFASQHSAFSNGMSRDEQENTKNQCQLEIDDLRKKWIKTSFSQYDKSAASHMLLPIIVTTLTGSIADGLLAAYLYETYACLEDLLWKKSMYFLHFTDSLVQDPGQALIAAILVPMSWRKKQFPQLYAVGTVLASVVLTLWVAPMKSALGWFEDSKDPITDVVALRFPVGLLMAYAIARKYNATNAINALKRLTRLWACIVIGSLMAMAGFYNEWIHPFQSSTYWIALVLLIHYNAVEFGTLEMPPVPPRPTMQIEQRRAYKQVMHF